jgi:hypothetical protein
VRRADPEFGFQITQTRPRPRAVRLTSPPIPIQIEQATTAAIIAREFVDAIDDRLMPSYLLPR